MYKQIAVLGGGLVKDNGKWRTTGYSDFGDKFGLSGDRLRLEAIRCLNTDGKVGKIILLGGKGQLHAEKDLRSVSYVMGEELKQMGIEESTITLEEKSGNTFEQLAALSELLDDGEYEVPLISNEFHLPRIAVMIDHLVGKDKERFGSLERFVPMSVEMIVLKYEQDRWQDEIDKAYSSEAMRERMEMESKGMDDLIKGRYTFTHYDSDDKEVKK
jgi:uncharacterized SAM-binding protein YcdF (DUF218 family)